MSSIILNFICTVDKYFGRIILFLGHLVQHRHLSAKSNRIHDVQVNLIITLSLGSMETDRVIGEPCYNEVIYNSKIINLGAMT